MKTRILVAVLALMSVVAVAPAQTKTMPKKPMMGKKMPMKKPMMGKKMMKKKPMMKKGAMMKSKPMMKKGG